MAKRVKSQASKSKSAFADLLKLHEGREEVKPEATAVPAEPAKAAVASELERKRGKSADPDYVKLTSYIRKDTHLQVKKKLLDEDKEISELVEELMVEWLKR